MIHGWTIQKISNQFLEYSPQDLIHPKTVILYGAFQNGISMYIIGNESFQCNIRMSVQSISFHCSEWRSLKAQNLNLHTADKHSEQERRCVHSSHSFKQICRKSSWWFASVFPHLCKHQSINNLSFGIQILMFHVARDFWKSLKSQSGMELLQTVTMLICNN